MFRITAHIVNGNDIAKITMEMRGANAAVAVSAFMIALRQLGFNAEDYTLTCSKNLLY